MLSKFQASLANVLGPCFTNKTKYSQLTPCDSGLHVT